MSRDQDEEELAGLADQFGHVIAHARVSGFDLADVYTAMAVALGRTSIGVTDDKVLWGLLGSFRDTARRVWTQARKAIDQAESVVHRGGDALRRRKARR